MAILVDYVCPTCTGRFEAWAATPPPTTHRCPACGGPARRAWSPIGLGRGPAAGSERHPLPAAEPSLCTRNPDVLGLCHMTPEAGRAWVARVRGDNRTLDRELAKQEAAAAVRTPRLEDVLSHSHSRPAPAG
ncbi:zinc ribbon domain-containing protein [Pseudonocardia sp. N23]|uniref:FmdB family zinc ribbon protein n=1 Tax=Pseudonocardia sp. N23 TaxID=1987376 RepID=UPI0011455501|nr:zinc ribbon domain-containing protein [Pseudonocardia sp. N23]